MAEQYPVIVAIVTTKRETVHYGSAPIFITKDEDELQKTSKSLERMLDASAHQIDPQLIAIVAR